MTNKNILNIRRLAYPVTAGILLIALLMITACNTVEGMGRDIEKAGQTIQDTF